jgi:DNA-binding response OmpR family regulator
MASATAALTRTVIGEPLRSDRLEETLLPKRLAQLRRKLEPDPAHPRHLLTEPGMGYRFVASGTS